MNLSERIEAFEKLGNFIRAIDKDELNEVAMRARNENSWFTKESVSEAFSGIEKLLQKKSLEKWLSSYYLTNISSKTVAVVMAGNIPLVGFHDLLCVLISGHGIMIKPSSKDTFLLKFVISKLTEIEPQFFTRIQIVDQLKNFDAVIATGSDNAARYFDYYFGKYPHIIRKNRTSCAILTGFESDSELRELGKDVFAYFGLGCRNVSKIYVPEQYDFTQLLPHWEGYDGVLLHHKYHNNYDYQKSILLVNRVPFLDSGFLILQESTRLVSPISVLYYEYYNNWESLLNKLDESSDKIQCIVGNAKPANVKIGQAQSPELSDYADKVDTLKFLQSIG
jgi:hypothetical protein